VHPIKLWLTYYMVSRASDSLGRDAGPAVREYFGLWETGLDLGGGGGAKMRSGRVWRFDSEGTNSEVVSAIGLVADFESRIFTSVLVY
jgi:hypothetical protein